MQEETFGQRFARLRKERNLTQDDLAKKLNVSSQAVSKWENDSSMPDISLLSPMSDIFDISIDELLGKKKEAIEYIGNKPELKKDINSMLIKLRVHSSDGDRVSMNIPVALAAMFASSDGKINISGNSPINNIDFKQVIALIQSGVIGHLMEVRSADGDIVDIDVE